MKYLISAEYSVLLWYLPQYFTIHGPPVYHKLNNPDTSLVCTTHIGLFWEPTTTRTPSTVPIKLHIKNTLVIFIRFFLAVISYNTESLVQSGNYSTITREDSTTNGLSSCKFSFQHSNITEY